MSNLSELLPTGGGQNAVDFVASGTLASGQTVALKTDGTVEAIAVIPASIGTMVTPAGSVGTDWAYTPRIAYDSTAQKMVILYRDLTDSNKGKAAVGTISGTSITFGTSVVFNATATIYFNLAYNATDQKMVITFKDSDNKGRAVVGTVSGTSISFGSEVQWSNGNVVAQAIAYDSTNNKLVISYRNDNNYGSSVVGTVSGTSISFGTPVVYLSDYFESIESSYDVASNRVVTIGTNGSNNNAVAFVGAVSGTGISWGSSVTFGTSITTQFLAIVYDSSAQKTVVVYQNSSSTGQAAVGTVSGNSISFGTAVQFSSTASSPQTMAYDANLQKIAVGYRSSSSGGKCRLIYAKVSGTTLTFDAFIELNTSAYPFTWPNIAYDPVSKNIAFIYPQYNTGVSAYTGSVQVFTNASTNNTSFIGITSEAIANTATGAVNVFGGINTVQTGLTIASDYYVQGNGTLSTASASPAIKVGQALSATTINMKDLT